VRGLVKPHRAVSRACPLLIVGDGPLQLLLAPKAVYLLVVQRPAFPSQQAVAHEPAPADVLGGDLEKTTMQLPLLNEDDLGRMALCAVVLAHHAAGPPLGWPVTLLQDRDGPPATLGVRSFPRQIA